MKIHGFTPLETKRPVATHEDECRTNCTGAGFHISRELLTGFTLLEVLVVSALAVVIALVSFLSLGNYRGQAELDATTKKLGTSLREAASRSIAQDSGASWGVRFDNTTARPFFSVFMGTYSTTSRVTYEVLPPTIGYISSTVPLGGFRDITFSPITGASSASTSVALFVIANPAASATIRVASSGVVFY